MKLTFTATAGQKVSIKLNPVTIGSNAVSGTTVTLLKGTTTVGIPTGVGTNGGYIDVTTLATAGTYTIKVDPQGVNTGSLTAHALHGAGRRDGHDPDDRRAPPW